MTKRERVEVTLNFEEPDRIPIYDLLYNDEAISYLLLLPLFQVHALKFLTGYPCPLHRSFVICFGFPKYKTILQIIQPQNGFIDELNIE